MSIPTSIATLWHQYLLTLALLLLATLSLAIHRLLSRPALPPHAPIPTSTNLPILGDINFFLRRRTWWLQSTSASPTGHFTYNIGSHTAVGVSGAAGRKFFFDSKDLAFSEGYAVLFGQAPDYNRAEEQTDGFDKWFSIRLLEMLKPANVSRILAVVMADARRVVGEMAGATNGLCDPYDVVYKLVFLVNMRTVGCQEVADDATLLRRVLHFYEMIEESSTAAGIIFPWLLTPAKIKRTYAGARLYMIFSGIARERKKLEKEIDDPLQFLLDKGDGMDKIIAFLMGALFAAQLNSGMNAAWILCYLGHSPEWKQRALEEIQAIASKYTTDPQLPLLDQLSDIPIEAWESEFPILDACLRDSIRLQLLGTAFRRNVSGRDLAIGDEVVPNGAFVTYHVGDIHQDPALFPDPERWDPSRHLDENAAYRKAQHGFVGWGSGRHPCLGMRFAKLEISLVVAHFVAAFEFETVERDGGRMVELPRVDQNGHAASRPTRPMWLKLEKRSSREGYRMSPANL